MYTASLDGRDTPPASGKEFIVAELEAKMAEIGVGEDGICYGTLLCYGP